MRLYITTSMLMRSKCIAPPDFDEKLYAYSNFFALRSKCIAPPALDEKLYANASARDGALQS